MKLEQMIKIGEPSSRTVASGTQIQQSRETREFRQLMAEKMPAWREEQIRKAHAKYIRDRDLREGKLKHPILKAGI